MDQNEDQNLQNFEKNNKFHFLKRPWQLIVSVSLFSLLLCYSCDFSLLPHSFINVCYTFFLSFFTHTLERKYVFLICNGILAFLAKSSGSCSSSTEMKASVSLNEKVPVGVGSIENVALVVEEEQEQRDTEEEAAAAKEAEEQELDIWSYGEENERESEALIAENEGKEEESISLMKQEEVQQEAEMEELAITDDLNKKFEEFIRKMKEKIRIEAQQQLIVV